VYRLNIGIGIVTIAHQPLRPLLHPTLEAYPAWPPTVSLKLPAINSQITPWSFDYYAQSVKLLGGGAIFKIFQGQYLSDDRFIIMLLGIRVSVPKLIKFDVGGFNGGGVWHWGGCI